jgi:hypothetical protein
LKKRKARIGISRDFRDFRAGGYLAVTVLCEFGKTDKNATPTANKTRLRVNVPKNAKNFQIFPAPHGALAFFQMVRRAFGRGRKIYF